MIGTADVRQNEIKMRAALSHSLSRVVGAKVSLPDFEDAVLSLLPEVAVQLRTLSRLVLPLVEPALFLLEFHDGSKADTRCILQIAGLPPGVSCLNHSSNKREEEKNEKKGQKIVLVGPSTGLDGMTERIRWECPEGPTGM